MAYLELVGSDSQGPHTGRGSHGSDLVKFTSGSWNLDLEKAEEPEIKLPTSAGSSKIKSVPEKTSISALLTISL